MLTHRMLSANLSSSCKLSFPSVPKIYTALGMQGIAAPPSSRYAVFLRLPCRSLLSHENSIEAVCRCAEVQKLAKRMLFGFRWDFPLREIFADSMCARGLLDATRQ